MAFSVLVENQSDVEDHSFIKNVFTKNLEAIYLHVNFVSLFVWTVSTITVDVNIINVKQSGECVIYY